MLAKKETLGLLIGNSKHLWPLFLKDYKESADLKKSHHPLDSYTTCKINKIFDNFKVQHKIIFVHRKIQNKIPIPRSALPPRDGREDHSQDDKRNPRDDTTYFPFQRLARFSGLADLSPSFLNIHPTFGPWFALRAVVSLNIEYMLRLPRPVQGLAMTVEICSACSKPCMPFFKIAAAVKQPRNDELKNNWKQWLAVRGACPMGNEYRYTQDQIKYHYKKEISILQNDNC
ncbi:MAG: hypothetical protein HYS98_00050 [Deltaproteobacteria bacterium]|nr:hypothetical protein [Deltaproteobacteria bacterium]